MRLRSLCLLSAALQLGSHALAAGAVEADPLDARVRTDSPPVSAAAAAAQRARDARGSSALAKGPLPDPVLLDGTNQPAEKKPEYGMLGEFELPGSDQKSDKAGGPQDEKAAGGGAKSDDKSDQKSGGGGGKQSPPEQNSPNAAAAAAAGAESADAAQSQSGGGAAGSDSSKGGTSGKAGAKGDPNAKAEGAQSSGLSGTEGGEAAAQSDAAPARPGEQKIGDATMQIKTQNAGTAPNVVGAQQPVTGKDTPQQYDTRTPGGGRQSGNSGGNKGVEKGQTMPTGL